MLPFQETKCSGNYSIWQDKIPGRRYVWRNRWLWPLLCWH